MSDELLDAGAAATATDTDTQGATGAQQTEGEAATQDGGTGSGSTEQAFETPWGEKLTKAELDDFRNDQKWKDANRRKGEDLNAQLAEVRELREGFDQRVNDGAQKALERLLAEQDTKDSEEEFRREMEQLEADDPALAKARKMYHDTEKLLQQAQSTGESSTKAVQEKLAALEERERTFQAAEHQRTATQLAAKHELGELGAPLVISIAQAFLAQGGPGVAEAGLNPEILAQAAQFISDKMIGPTVAARIAAKVGKAQQTSGQTAANVTGGAPAQGNETRTGPKTGDVFGAEERANRMFDHYQAQAQAGNLPG